MLQATRLRKTFGTLVAVDDVDLQIESGEFFGLLGPNGAGKTTTISMLVGDLAPDSGEVRLAGEIVSPNAHRARAAIGYVPQELAIYDTISSRDNLRFFGALYGLNGAEAQRRIDGTLEVVGLRDRDREPVARFSGGMKRRLNIAAALMHQPKFLVLDEPTVGVDPQSRNAIFETLEALQRDGMTILYTTHYMEEVERLCRRVAVIDRGKVIAQDTIAGLRTLLPNQSEVTVNLAQPIDEAPSWPYTTVVIDGGLRVEIGDVPSDLPKIFELAARDGLVVTGVQTRVATLEEVFLHVTGRNLRDA